jgi:uncharacterized protein (TIGR03067 family)
MLRTTLLAAVFLALGADDPKAAEKKELEALQGTWQVESLIVNGKDFFADGQARFHFVVNKNGEASLDGNDFVKKFSETFNFKLDPSTTPRCADIVVTAGQLKGVKMEGIYEFKGVDELRVCAKVGGNERPAKFESVEGTDTILAVLKRQKK